MSLYTQTDNKGSIQYLNKTRIIVLGAFLAIAALSFFTVGKNYNQTPETQNSQAIITKEQIEPSDQISYKGESGKNALTILESVAEVKKDTSGLVKSINGRATDNSKKEFWAFYVNDEMAQVGPADYETKDTDMIEWKIETY